MERLAQQAAGRLATMTLAEQAETLALLEILVKVAEEGLRVTGTVCELELSVEYGLTETEVPYSHGPPAGAG